MNAVLIRAVSLGRVPILSKSLRLIKAESHVSRAGSPPGKP